MALARVDEDVVRVFGMKLTRARRRSLYEFRQLGRSWRIWGIDEVAVAAGEMGPEPKEMSDEQDTSGGVPGLA